MDTKYIYPSTVAYTLHQKLPTETQRDLLFTAKNSEEFFKALQDTFIAPHLVPGEEDKLTHVLDTVVLDAKRELVHIAPEPQLLEILWLKYDFQNLKTLITWSSLGLTDEELGKSWIHLGCYELSEFLKAFQEEKLEALNSRLYQALEESKRQTSDTMKDMVLDANYLRAARDMAANTKNKFIKEYIKTQIDLFNLLSRLRVLANLEDETIPQDFFIHGGSFELRDLESEESILRLLTRFGGKAAWNEAFTEYNENKSFSAINRIADEYVLGWLKRESIELYSPAPLVAYFIAVKNSVQMIRAVAAAKQLGIDEQKVRNIVRKPYQSYAF